MLPKLSAMSITLHAASTDSPTQTLHVCRGAVPQLHCSSVPRQARPANPQRPRHGATPPHVGWRLLRALARALSLSPAASRSLAGLAGRGEGWDQAGRCGLRARVTGRAVAEVAARGGAGGQRRKEAAVQDGGDDLRAAEAAYHT